MELYMKFIKTVGVCAVVALGVGATSATAASLITSANIKDGTIKMRDLSPSLKAKIKKANAATAGVNGTNGAKGDAGANGANGANGLDGAAGANGVAGAKGDNGSDGADGQDGRDGVRYDRISGSCDSEPYARRRGLDRRRRCPPRCADPAGLGPDQSYPKNLKVSQIEKLSFTANATDGGRPT